eukprot:TRINITY_DN67061_c7_g1_i4.p1 TRINITY_DN67061_c7_g1~~TRINITY_DN67061_c7_g1_i4.p1  ORF type:complete len:703 (-),score=86.45 TRINITY_DN67061_c7_g1_i4:208-2037(-)
MYHANSRVVREWHTDEMFGFGYVAGVDPMIIKLVDRKTAEEKITNNLLSDDPARNKILNIIEDDNVELFLVEFEEFKYAASESQNLMQNPTFQTGVGPNGYTHFMPNPICLLARNTNGTRLQHTRQGSNTLHRNEDQTGVPVPIAIKLFGKDDTAVYTYDDYDNTRDDARWMVAKYLTNLAAGIRHELFDHLFRSHIVVESVVVATMRQLPSAHPVFRLLHPHFLFTTEINDFARSHLIPLINHQIFAAGAVSIGEYAGNWVIQDNNPIEDVKKRGFGDHHDDSYAEKEGRRYYPYAKASQRIFNAMLDFCTKILNEDYAQSNDTVKKDEYITEWLREINEKGFRPGVGSADSICSNQCAQNETCISGCKQDFKDRDIEMEGLPERKKWAFPTTIETIPELASLVATIMYSASAHHAAINFPQWQSYAFPPAAPLTTHQVIKKLPLKHKKMEWNFDDMHNFLPEESALEKTLLIIWGLSTRSESSTPYLEDMFRKETKPQPTEPASAKPGEEKEAKEKAPITAKTRAEQKEEEDAKDKAKSEAELVQMVVEDWFPSTENEQYNDIKEGFIKSLKDAYKANLADGQEDRKKWQYPIYSWLNAEVPRSVSI